MAGRALLAWLIFPAVVWSQARAERLPMPGEAALLESAQLISDVYKKEFQAAQAPVQKQALAKKLLEDGLNTKDDAAAQYSLLDAARKLAAQAGDLELANSAADKLSEMFTTSTAHLKALSLLDAGKNLRTPEDYFYFGRFADRLYPALRSAAAWQAAEDVAQLAEATALKARDGEFVKLWEERAMEIAAFKKLSATAQSALEQLRISPIDPLLNETAGRWYCFVLEDWGTGIPLLALAKDPALQQIAERELRVVKDVDRLTLADSWSEFAKTLDRHERRAVLRHAQVLFGQAEVNLTGLSQARATKGRLETFAEGMPSRTPLALLPPRIQQAWGKGPELSSLTVAGRLFPNTYRAVPLTNGNSRLVFDLPGDCKYLIGLYGIERGRPHNSLQFRVLGDNGRELWAAPKRIQTSGQLFPFQVDLRGQRTIELIVECKGFNGEAHAVWIEPLLQR